MSLQFHVQRLLHQKNKRTFDVQRSTLAILHTKAKTSIDKELDEIETIRDRLRQASSLVATQDVPWIVEAKPPAPPAPSPSPSPAPPAQPSEDTTYQGLVDMLKRAFPFASKEECNTTKRSAPQFMNKEAIINTIANDTELKQKYTRITKSMSKSKICDELFAMKNSKQL